MKMVKSDLENYSSHIKPMIQRNKLVQLTIEKRKSIRMTI